MESTNSYAANTLSKDYNTEDTSFIGCISIEDNTVLPSNDHLENFNSFTISNWIIDSGASLHVTYSINLLKNIKKCNESISLPNGKIVTSTKYGSFTGYVNNNEIKLNKVFYVPNITKNIISLSELIKHNYKVVFLNPSIITIKFLPLYLISIEIKLPIFHLIITTFSKYGFQIAYITSMFENIHLHLLCTYPPYQKLKRLTYGTGDLVTLT